MIPRSLPLVLALALAACAKEAPPPAAEQLPAGEATLLQLPTAHDHAFLLAVIAQLLES